MPLSVCIVSPFIADDGFILPTDRDAVEPDATRGGREN